MSNINGPDGHLDNFYTVGGAMDPSAESYVVRSADSELMEGILQGDFCYILTSRQLGKSSLVAHTKQKLKDKNFTTSVIDLTTIGSDKVSESEWYLGQIYYLVQDMGLNIDVESWWSHRQIGSVQRYFSFISEVILTRISNSVVIFVDEIDDTLKLDFSDNFFAGIRALYNRRSAESIYKRITFALLGAASPADLIKDPQRTPFNIGRRILLTDFTFAEAEPLANGLGLDHGSSLKVLEQILNWTKGHPYLTQKVCQLISKRVVKEQPNWIKQNAEIFVRELIEEEFLSGKGNDDDNLKSIHRTLVQYSDNDSYLGNQPHQLTANSSSILKIYNQIWRGEKILDDALSPLISSLKLSGIVVPDTKGYLRIRNKIYYEFFDNKWIGDLINNRTEFVGNRSVGARQFGYTSTQTRLRVFVASPNDVLDARKVLEEVVDDLNFSWGKRSGLLLELVDWRTHVTPYLDKPPQTTLINQLPVETWDLFIGILWSRFGTPIYETNPDTGQKYQSGTEHEFDLAYKCYKSRGQPKILFYRCTKPINPDIDSKQLELVQEFFKQFQVDGQHHGLYASYESLDEFRRNIFRHLTDALLNFQQGIDSRPLMGELGHGIQHWLEQVNLLGNPFRYSNAGLDDKLAYYHHYPSDSELNELVGNTTESPQSYIIVGDYGMGKTTIRQIITHVGKQKLGGRNVFSILYTDFSALLEKLALSGSLSPRDHVDQIIVAGLKALNIALGEGTAQISSSVSTEDRRNFLHYVNKYQNKLRETERKTIINSIGTISESNTSENLPDSYIEMFYGFCRAIRIYGYDIVYILMDQLDESGIADDGKIVELLTPLLSDRHLMEAPDALAIFRIFLPAHINALMRVD